MKRCTRCTDTHYAVRCAFVDLEIHLWGATRASIPGIQLTILEFLPSLRDPCCFCWLSFVLSVPHGSASKVVCSV